MTASAFRCGSNRRSSAKEARDNHHRRILFISPRTLVLPFFCDGRSSGRLASFVSFLTRAKEPPKAPDQQKGCDYSRHGRATAALSMSTIAEAEFALPTPFRQPGIGLQSQS